jgi:hypothetical protein
VCRPYWKDEYCKQQLPHLAFDDWLEFYKSTRRFVDVSALTANGPVTFTLSGTAVASGSSQPPPTISGGATDALRQATRFTGAGADQTQPYWPVQLNVKVTPVSFAMYMTSSKTFRPRDGRDPVAVSGCDQNPDDCRQTLEVCIAGVEGSCLTPSEGRDTNVPLVTYQLRLSPAKDPATGNPRPWLPGQSTNFGKDKADVPDYVFESTKTPSLTMTSVSALEAQRFTVLSQDYGGMAWLSGKATLQGKTVDIGVPDAEGYVGAPSTSPPSCVALKDFLQHPFISLPVDQDCNGIADSWEAPYANALLGMDHFPDPSIDTDFGAQGTETLASIRGDGLSVHDEYRGFHVGQSRNPKWISTDPTRQDLFYWDAGKLGTTHCAGDHPDIFDCILGQSTKGFMDIHPVDELLSHGNRAATTRKNAQGKIEATNTAPINQNSIYKMSLGNSPQPRIAYAVIYVDQPLGKGTSGRSGEDGEFDFSYRNAGTRIYIDKKQITDFTKMPAGTLLAKTIAHETGHKLGRDHPRRCADTPVAYDPTTAGRLGIDEFMQESRKRLDVYVRYKIYDLNGINRRETLAEGNYKIVSQTAAPNSSVTPPDWTYKLRLEKINNKVPTAVFVRAHLQTQEGLLMDWTADLNLTLPSMWQWNPRDINTLCLLPNGCSVSTTVWPKCSF